MLKILLLILVASISIVLSCPLKQTLRPCLCDESGLSFSITCPDLENEQTLIDAVYALRTTTKFYSFSIKNGNFMYIPHDIFKGLAFQELEIQSSSFMALTDTEIAFEGLEENLASLVIKDSTVLNDWDWSVLRNLKKLLKLHIDVDLDIISKDIEIISSPNIKDISFANNKINYIHESAFAGFKELLALDLKNNHISELRRSMLPNPATLLWKLDMSENQIQQLPPTLFENMPSLEILNLKSNSILTLSEKALGKLWEQLRDFNAMNNPLRCDCRLQWMMNLRFPANTHAVCEQPLQLQGKKLQELTDKDVWC